MKRILVTGGAGFIGSHVVKRLLKSNYYVVVIDDLSFGKKKMLPLHNENLELVKCDMTDRSVLADQFHKFEPEIVIHLGAIHSIPYCNKYPVRTSEVNIMGTRNLLENCGKLRPKIVLYASSAAVYPITDGPNTENSATGPIDVYGLTKIMGEDLCKLFHLETGVDTIVMRLFNAYGPNETNPHVIPEIINQLKFGNRKIELGNLLPKRDYIHVKDVTEAIMVLLDGFKGGTFEIFNVASGEEYSVSYIVELCEKIMGEKINVKQTKSRMRKNERMHLRASISKIRNSTDWLPKIDFEQGLKQLLIEAGVITLTSLKGRDDKCTT